MMMMKILHSNYRKLSFIFFFFLFNFSSTKAAYLLINMDDAQTNHLKAYGIAYLSIQKEIDVNWLLNYKGGAFLLKLIVILKMNVK